MYPNVGYMDPEGNIAEITSSVCIGGSKGCQVTLDPKPSLRVHVPNIWALRLVVIVITVQVLGKYMNIRYLDP